MKRLSPLRRISIGLVLLTISILLTGDLFFGVMSEGPDSRLEARRRLTEALAVQFSSLAAKNDFDTVQVTLENVVERSSDVLSAALRTVDGTIRAEAGVHSRYWEDIPFDKSTPTAAQVPIYMGNERWGTVQIRFTPLAGIGFANLLSSSFIQLIAYVSITGFFAYMVFMRRTLKHLDPSAVVPRRVKTALDALAEGVVFIDEKSEIVLTNSAFRDQSGSTTETLLGIKLSDMNWMRPAGVHNIEDPPWQQAIRSGKKQVGTRMCLDTPSDGIKTFTVNGSPILDDDGKSRGVLVTFDDVTELEEKNNQLHELVAKLKGSRDEIHRQNEKLQILAARDPLTDCLNRRAFFERCEAEFAVAVADESPLSSIMLDIDHFKNVNDTHGHAVGDRVIQSIADRLRSVLRSIDIVGRYGGEEFCVLLPGLNTDQAAEIAERLREQIEEHTCEDVNELERAVTISLGVASLQASTMDAAQLVDAADKGLYASKNNGRNRVTRWDDLNEVNVA